MSDLYDELVDRYFAKWELARAARQSEKDGIALLRQYATEGQPGQYGCSGVDFSTGSGHVRFWPHHDQPSEQTVTIAKLATDAWRRHCAPNVQMKLL